jgi:hypothetical protein
LSDRKLNKSPTTVEDPAVLKQPLTDPKLKKITLHFPLGLEVTARNMKGVTIKDALDAIHKQFKKRVSTYHTFPYRPLLQHQLRDRLAPPTPLSKYSLCNPI